MDRDAPALDLRAARDLITALPLEVPFRAGETIRTEISAKFRKDGVGAELAAAGFALAGWWSDPAGDFGLSLSFAR